MTTTATRGIFRPSFWLFRVGAIVCFAMIALFCPEVGANRHLLATLCVFVFLPLAVLLEWKLPSRTFGWSQPLFDCTGCALATQFVPNAWAAIFMVGLITANSRLIVPTRSNLASILGAHLILVTGMCISAIVHDVQGWTIPMLAVLASMPAVLCYAPREAAQIAERRQQRERFESMALIAAGIAHDFNNYLTGICVNAQLAKKAVPADHLARKSIDAVLEASDSATLFTRQLTDIASQRSSSIKTVTNVAVEVERLIKLLENVVPKDVEISFVVDGEIPTASVDRVELQQVVINLVLNAAESVEPPNTVRVELGFGQGDLKLDVTDRGQGIPNTIHARILEPFFGSKAKGSRNGLSIVSRIVDAAGGTIQIESRVGQGTQVRVTLPVGRDASDGSPNGTKNLAPT